LEFSRSSSRKTISRYNNNKWKIARGKDEKIIRDEKEMKKTEVKILRGNKL